MIYLTHSTIKVMKPVSIYPYLAQCLIHYRAMKCVHTHHHKKQLRWVTQYVYIYYTHIGMYIDEPHFANKTVWTEACFILCHFNPACFNRPLLCTVQIFTIPAIATQKEICFRKRFSFRIWLATNICLTYPWRPDRTSYKFRADPRILCSLETMTDCFWGSKSLKCSIGWCHWMH